MELTADILELPSIIFSQTFLEKYVRELVFDIYPHIWGKEFKNGPGKICGRQPFKIWAAAADHAPLTFLKFVFLKFYLVHSWILCPIFTTKNQLTNGFIGSSCMNPFRVYVRIYFNAFQYFDAIAPIVQLTSRYS